MIQADSGGKSILAERYELVREVGRGGMATVYLAEDQKHLRQVAGESPSTGAIGGARQARHQQWAVTAGSDTKNEPC